MNMSTIDMPRVQERADWLERALSTLPAQTRSGDWRKDILQSQARRDAEFAIAAALRAMQPGRATITVSDRNGTAIRMFGLRVASPDGFEAACRAWIRLAREQVGD